jgi:hypothetical protein
MDHDNITIATFHRPIRGAWLIGESRSPVEDEVFAELALACCEWWEGRNSLLIKATEESLTQEQQRNLRLHDPDELITLVPTSAKLLDQIDGLVDPLVCSKRTNVQNPISQREFQLHTVFSLPNAISLNRRNDSLFNEEPPTLVLFAFAKDCPAAVRNCVAVNFGAYGQVTHSDGRLDFGFSERLWKDLPHRVFVLKTIDDFAAALDEIAGDFTRAGLRFVSPMQLAGGRDDQRQRWPIDDQFQVFVGESFEDADLFWHQTILDGSWRLCLRFRFYLPTSLAREPTMRVPLQKWLARMSSAGSSNHKSPLFVSKSLSQTDLQQIADELLHENKLAIFRATAEHRAGLTFADEPDRLPAFFHQLEKSEMVEISRISRLGGTVHVTPPEILDRLKQNGRWMADVFVQMPAQRGIEQKSESLLRLPQCRAREVVNHMFRPAARVKIDGYPSVALSGVRPAIAVHIPRIFDLFLFLIQSGRRYATTTDLRSTLPQRESAPFQVRVSNPGRRYRATISLFESLGTAAHYFESVLWREIFSELASEKASSDAALQSQIKGVLSKTYQGADANQHERATERIINKIQGRSAEVRLTLAQMEETRQRLSSGENRPFHTAQHLGNSILHDESACPYDAETLPHGLTDLMMRGVAVAGFELKCLHCGSTIWLSLDYAAQRGECPDCGTPWAAEAEMPFHYRLTALAKRAVQKSGGAMPVVLAVWRLLLESKASFFWQPNLEIFRPDFEKGARPWGELDIVCLVDGKFVIGEVKQSVDQFKLDDFEDLRKICSVIQPDLALLAFTEGEFREDSEFAERFKKLQSQLASRTNVEWRKSPSRW